MRVIFKNPKTVLWKLQTFCSRVKALDLSSGLVLAHVIDVTGRPSWLEELWTWIGLASDCCCKRRDF